MYVNVETCTDETNQVRQSLDSKVNGANMGPSGADRTQVCPILDHLTLFSGSVLPCVFTRAGGNQKPNCGYQQYYLLVIATLSVSDWLLLGFVH